MKNQTFLHRLAFAFDGLLAAWRTENSFKTHVVAAAFVYELVHG
jgi:diacylglycerol kinase